MKIQIQQKGGIKNHSLIEAAARFYASELMSTRMCNTLKIVIKMRRHAGVKGKKGSCSTPPTGSITSKEFMIIISTKHSFDQQMCTLAHEMVHVRQKAMNELQTRKWKSDKKFHVRWKGQDHGIYNSIPWGERPWEIEARSLQDDLVTKFKKKHYINVDVNKFVYDAVMKMNKLQEARV
jgi:hypothetical protein